MYWKENKKCPRSDAYVGTLTIKNGKVATPGDIMYFQQIKDICKQKTKQLRDAGIKDYRFRWRLRGRKPLPGKSWIASAYGGSSYVPLNDAQEADLYVYRARDFEKSISTYETSVYVRDLLKFYNPIVVIKDSPIVKTQIWMNTCENAMKERVRRIFRRVRSSRHGRDQQMIQIEKLKAEKMAMMREINILKNKIYELEKEREGFMELKKAVNNFLTSR